MELVTETFAWFVDPEQWSGRNGIPFRLAQHLWLALVPTVIAAAIALPTAAWLAHRRIGEVLANAVVNVGRAIPSFGVIIFLAVAFITAGRSAAFWPLVLAMILLALPPMFTNTYTGIADVDRSLVEAARGMGYTERQVLRRVELPAATPVILAGVRIAFVQVVATVALGAVVQGRTGGFGVYIINGFAPRGAAGGPRRGARRRPARRAADHRVRAGDDAAGTHRAAPWPAPGDRRGERPDLSRMVTVSDDRPGNGATTSVVSRLLVPYPSAPTDEEATHAPAHHPHLHPPPPPPRRPHARHRRSRARARRLWR